MSEAPCKLSVCVPIYNSGDYIERCAVSLFEQSYSNIEYIFVNDCTKDNSMMVLDDVMNRYPQKRSQIRIVKHQKNLGLAGARLTGLNNATGDYVWFVDSDDYVEVDTVNKLIPYMRDGKDLIAFSFLEELKDRVIQRPTSNLSVNRVLIHAVSPSIWKCVAKRSLFYDNKILPQVGINYMEDFFLLSRLVLVSKEIISLDKDFLYHYNCSNMNSMMNTVNIKAMEQCAKVVGYIDDYYIERNAHNKYNRALLVMLGRQYLNLQKVDRNSLLYRELGDKIRSRRRFFYLVLSSCFPNLIKRHILWALSMTVVKK